VLCRPLSSHLPVIESKRDTSRRKHYRFPRNRGAALLPREVEYTTEQPMPSLSEQASLAWWLAWLERSQRTASPSTGLGTRAGWVQGSSSIKQQALSRAYTSCDKIEDSGTFQRCLDLDQSAYKNRLTTGKTFPRSLRSTRTECKRLPPGPSREPACDGLSLGAAHSGATEQ